MIMMRYTVACDRCGRSTPGVEFGSGTSKVWFDTGRGARAHARWCRWLRIPRGDPRDESRARRGMDVCTECIEVSDRDPRAGSQGRNGS